MSDSEQCLNRLQHDLISLSINISCAFGANLRTRYDFLWAKTRNQTRYDFLCAKRLIRSQLRSRFPPNTSVSEALMQTRTNMTHIETFSDALTESSISSSEPLLPSSKLLVLSSQHFVPSSETLNTLPPNP